MRAPVVAAKSGPEAASARSQAGLSRLESAFAERSGQRLRQFGYGLLSPPPAGSPPAAAPPAAASPMGSVPGDYLLGIGDELQVTLRGQRNSTKRYTVDREGRLILDDLPPLLAAGRSLAELRQELAAAVAASLLETEVWLSLAELRRIGVLVVGEVARPGRHALTGLSTLLDALIAAGGITAEGSLRRLSLVHGGRSDAVDLYQVLLTGRGGGADLRLAEGDRVVVPPLGPVVAVAGAVRRPAIYELAPDGPPTLAELLALAGGPLRPGPQRLLRLNVGAGGADALSEIAAPEQAVAADGDVLLVSPRGEQRLGEVRLEGHVRRPGPRALAGQPTLSALVGAEELLPGPYLPFAALETTDPGNRARVLVPVDLQAAVDGQDPRPLSDGDTLIVLGAGDIDFLSAAPVLELLRGRTPPARPECAGLAVLARVLAADPRGRLARGPLARAAATLRPALGRCPPVFERHADLLTFALDHAVLVLSGVPRPGFYPTAGSADADSLTQAAGGSLGPAGTGSGARAGASAPAGRDAVLEVEQPGVELAGAFRHPGFRPLSGLRSLAQALGRGEAMAAEAYPLFGLIERFDRTHLTRQLLPFAPAEVVAGRFDRGLIERDRLVLFGAAEMRRWMEAALAAPQPPPEPEPAPSPADPAAGRPASPAVESVREPPSSKTARRELTKAGGESAAKGRLEEPGSGSEPGRSAAEPEPGFPPGDALVLAAVRDHGVRVEGAVYRPGYYPLGQPVSLAALLAVAGGTGNRGPVEGIELTGEGRNGPVRQVVALQAAGAVTVNPGDAVLVAARPPALESRGVTVEGEVMRPGRYPLVRGDTLSALLARAGGLTAEAYPAGAVFLRDSARRRESEEFRRAARDIERSLAGELLKAGAEPPRAEGVALARQLANELRVTQGLGRVAVEADPGLLRARPELDILLEPGDRLILPRRSLVVAVTGEVLAPGSFQFVSGKRAEDYLAEAGGFTRNADDDRAFVLLPNGSARPLAVSAWRYAETGIPPGSTIVVPRDPRPFDFLELARNVGGILGQLALTAASIAVISHH